MHQTPHRHLAPTSTAQPSIALGAHYAQGVLERTCCALQEKKITTYICDIDDADLWPEEVNAKSFFPEADHLWLVGGSGVKTVCYRFI